MKGICKKAFCLLLLVCMCLSSFNIVSAKSNKGNKITNYYCLNQVTEMRTCTNKKVYLGKNENTTLHGLNIKSFKQSNKNVSIKLINGDLYVYPKKSGSTVVTYKDKRYTGKFTIVVNGFKEFTNSNCVKAFDGNCNEIKSKKVYKLPKKQKSIEIECIESDYRDGYFGYRMCYSKNRVYKVYVDGKLVKSEKNTLGNIQSIKDMYVKIPNKKGNHKIVVKAGKVSKTFYVVYK